MRALLRPGWMITHLLVIATAVSFISLGLWQIRRHGEQQVENDRVAVQQAGSPLALSAVLGSGADDDLDLLPVQATGRFDDTATVSLSPRSRNELPGLELLTPLQTDDTVLLINRGWIPLDSDPPPAPSGEVTVSGRLRDPRSSRQILRQTPGSEVVTSLSSVDLEALAPQMTGLFTDAYLEVVDENARLAGAIPRPAPPIPAESGPHLYYAAQWFAFTAIGLIGYPLLLRRRIADKAEAEADPTATPGDRSTPTPVGTK